MAGVRRAPLRWKFFAVCLGLAVVALAAQVVVGSCFPAMPRAGVGGKLNDFTTATALAALVVLLTTPLQAAGEEYVFRGYLLQAVGSLFRTAGSPSVPPDCCSPSRTACRTSRCSSTACPSA